MAKAKDTIPKKLRFEVFKRDCFTCIYCGRRPPDVVLHADHRIPEIEGGATTILNLVTSCMECNLGKGRTELADHAFLEKHHEDAARLQEKQEQLEMIAEWYKTISKHGEQCEQIISDFFKKRVPGLSLGKSLLNKLVRYAEKNNGLDTILDAIADLVAERIQYQDDGNATKESAEQIATSILYVAKIKHALKDFPLVKANIDSARYMYGVLRGKSKKYELPDIVEFYRQLEAVLQGGQEMADVMSYAKNGRGYNDWCNDLGVQEAAAIHQSRRSEKAAPIDDGFPTNEEIKVALEKRRAAIHSDASPWKFNETLFFDEDRKYLDLSPDQAVAALLNAKTSFTEQLYEIGLQDAREWADRAGPWIEAVYCEVRQALLDAEYEVKRLHKDLVSDKIWGIVHTTFDLFFDGSEAPKRPDHFISGLLRKAMYAKDWWLILQEYSLSALNDWLEVNEKSVMYRYTGYSADRLTPDEYVERYALTYYQESMAVVFPYPEINRTLLEVIEQPGTCEEEQDYQLDLHTRRLMREALVSTKKEVDQEIENLFIHTVKLPALSAASVLCSYTDEQGDVLGGYDYLANRSLDDLYCELLMRSGFEFPRLMDVRPFIRTMIRIHEDKLGSLRMLTDACGGLDFGEFMSRLVSDELLALENKVMASSS